MQDYENAWEDYWEEIVTQNGIISLDKIKRELFDYSNLLDQVPKVYMEVTGGRISKPNTMAFEVIGEFNNLINDSVEDAVKEETAPLKQRISKIESAIREFIKNVDDYKNSDPIYLYGVAIKFYANKFSQLIEEDGD